MKSLEELKAIRERMQNQVNLRESGTGATRAVSYTHLSRHRLLCKRFR